MKAVCWMGKSKIETQIVDDPQILNPHDAIIKVTRTAICGSDLHLFDGFISTIEQGDIMGHEFMGIVEEVGAGVSNLKIGDRVPSVHNRLWAVFLLQEETVGRLRQHEPERPLDGSRLRLLGVRSFRVLAHDGRVRGRSGTIRSRPLRRHWPFENRERSP